jgi:hypothetical protein
MAWRRAISAVALVACARGIAGDVSDDPLVASADAGCTGLACKRVSCESGKSTRVTGRVTDPAGARGVYDVAVYVVDGAPPPVVHGARCDACSKRALGSVVSTLTDARGEFVLDDVPVDPDLPIVIEIGRFRRIAHASIAPCAETRLAEDATRLPRTSTEGELPLVAVTTGASDALECLLRSIGIDDREFVRGGDPNGRVHLYQGHGGGTRSGTGIPDAATLWNDPKTLAPYDAVLLSCEGGEFPENKGTRGAMRDYAMAGGHVFATHFHSTWLSGSPSDDFRAIATWPGTKDTSSDYTVDTSFPKGEVFADWLVTAGASTTRGTIHLDDVAYSLGVSNPPAQRWIASDSPGAVRYFSFNTPIGAAPPDQCGRFTFADLHAYGLGGSDFPDGCPPLTQPLSPQQLALEFLLFDQFACVDDDRVKPTPPH